MSVPAPRDTLSLPSVVQHAASVPISGVNMGFEMVTAVPGSQARHDAMRTARDLFAAWLQRCLRQGAYRQRAQAVAAVPTQAITRHLDQAVQGVAEAASLALAQTNLAEALVDIELLVESLAAAIKTQPEALRIYDQLVERGLETLQHLAQIEVELTAQQAGLDPLTGLPGRRALQHCLLAEQARVRRHADDCALVLIDLDCFKRVNDRYGHLAGDRYLAAFAGVLGAELRPYDRAFRYGGDEFVLCLPQATTEQASAAVERIRGRLKRQPLLVIMGQPLYAEFSAGIAALERGQSVTHSLAEADASLYAAKQPKSVPIAAPGPRDLDIFRDGSA
ncbi:MAG: GGDEF domain-containing protein [Proteobacteria bacterium]|nr:GGDEF domain-containing protein [Pseudomonadota bacterium]